MLRCVQIFLRKEEGEEIEGYNLCPVCKGHGCSYCLMVEF